VIFKTGGQTPHSFGTTVIRDSGA